MSITVQDPLFIPLPETRPAPLVRGAVPCRRREGAVVEQREEGVRLPRQCL